MNKLKIFMLALTACLLSGCMDGNWDDPTELNSRGNKAIVESNVISIAQLKSQYKNYITTDYRDGKSYTKITSDIQIKGVVTGNDIEGNLYNEISLQDETGAIIIAISEGGIWGYLPIGTEIVVDLKDLYIGNYGLQAQIGVPYTNASGNTYVSRMSKLLWNSHFKLTGNTKNIEPVTFNNSTWDNFNDGAKLATIKNVRFDVPNDTTTFASPNSGAGSKSIYFKGIDKSVMVYTSNYADFAATYVPTGKVNVTGIVITYNRYKEFIIRSIDDVQPAN
ncbi:MAG: DUF5689 domain-containing protein [Prevotella sp.]|jgi:hypothetical protein|nr:DUF5689 domain-containing protein [Prevotella sp.]